MHFENNLPEFWQWIPRSAIWVNVFFLISGYVIQFSLLKLNSIQFLVQRAFRILPIYWLCILLQLLIDYFIFAYSREGVLGSLVLTQSSILVVGWTLLIEVRFYILCALIHFFTRNTISLVISFHAIFFLNLAASLALGVSPLHVSDTYFFCFMGLGTILYAYEAGLFAGRKYIALALFLLTYLEFIVCRVFLGLFTDNDVVAFISAVPIVYVAVIWFNDFRFPGASLLGKISYSLYCIHFPLGWLISFWLITWFGVSPLFSLISATLGSLIASYVTYTLVERPFQNIGKSLSYRLQNWQFSFTKSQDPDKM